MKYNQYKYKQPLILAAFNQSWFSQEACYFKLKHYLNLFDCALMVLLLLWRLDSRLNANASVRETPTGFPYASKAQSQAHSVLYVVCNKAV